MKNEVVYVYVVYNVYGPFGAYTQEHVAEGVAKLKNKYTKELGLGLSQLYHVKEMEVATLPDNGD